MSHFAGFSLPASKSTRLESNVPSLRAISMSDNVLQDFFSMLNTDEQCLDPTLLTQPGAGGSVTGAAPSGTLNQAPPFNLFQQSSNPYMPPSNLMQQSSPTQPSNPYMPPSNRMQQSSPTQPSNPYMPPSNLMQQSSPMQRQSNPHGPLYVPLNPFQRASGAQPTPLQGSITRDPPGKSSRRHSNLRRVEQQSSPATSSGPRGMDAVSQPHMQLYDYGHMMSPSHAPPPFISGLSPSSSYAPSSVRTHDTGSMSSTSSRAIHQPSKPLGAMVTPTRPNSKRVQADASVGSASSRAGSSTQSSRPQPAAPPPADAPWTENMKEDELWNLIKRIVENNVFLSYFPPFTRDALLHMYGYAYQEYHDRQLPAFQIGKCLVFLRRYGGS